MTPLKLLCDQRGMEFSELRSKSGILTERLFKLLNGRGKKMTEAEERKLAMALNISRAALRPPNFSGCSTLDVDEDEILANCEEEGC